MDSLISSLIYNTLLFGLPSWITNISFNLINPLKKRFPLVEKMNIPLDGQKILSDGERLLGGSQGLLSIPLIIVVPFILSFILPETYPILLLKSLCVFAGDALGSFIKRRLHVPRGSFLAGVDHADYMWVTVIVFLSINQVDLVTGCMALILTYVFHPLVCLFGYKLGIKDEPL